MAFALDTVEAADGDGLVAVDVAEAAGDMAAVDVAEAVGGSVNVPGGGPGRTVGSLNDV